MPDSTGKLTAAELYRDLRRLGTVFLKPEQSGIVAGARTKARADGLRVMTSRGSRKGMTNTQARNRPIEVSLTDPLGTNIVAPDFDTDPVADGVN